MKQFRLLIILCISVALLSGCGTVFVGGYGDVPCPLKPHTPHVSKKAYTKGADNYIDGKATVWCEIYSTKIQVHVELQVKIGGTWHNLGDNWTDTIKHNVPPGREVKGMGVGPCLHGYLYRTKAKGKSSTANDPGDWSGWIYGPTKRIYCLP